MRDGVGAETGSEVRYKVGEICRLADVQPYVLRYWENEFPVLAGDRSQPGPRTYSDSDLKVIQRIKNLLYVEGFTIAGAKKRLEGEMRSGMPEPEPNENDTAPVPAVTPPPLPGAAPASEPKPRRTRSKAVSVPSSDEMPEIFEEEVSEPRPAPVAAKASTDEVRTGVVTPPQVRPDPRLPKVVSELRAILEILSRER